MCMHVIDDATMQDLIRFVKAHHTFARHNRVMRQHMLELQVILQKLRDAVEKEEATIEQAKAIVAKKTRKKA